MSKVFEVRPYDHADKVIHISGPGIELDVDYDDVDHDLVDTQVKLLLDILEEHGDVFQLSEHIHHKMRSLEN